MIRAFLIGAALALAQPAFSEIRASYSQDGRTLFSFEVPDFWTLNSGGERMIRPPDEDLERPAPQVVSLRPTVDPEVWIGFFAPRGVRTLDEGEAYLAEIEKFLTRTPEITSNAPGRVAGLPARIIRGTGQRNGRQITFSIAVMDLPGPRIAIGAGIAEAGADPALVDQLNAIFASVRAAR